MTKLNAIIDTWNMIEKYNIQGWKQIDDRTVEIPDSEYERMYEAAVDKKYINNLRRGVGAMMFGH